MQRNAIAAAVALAVGLPCAAQAQVAQLGEVVVTASRFREKLDDKPVNMTVITAEDIRRSAAKTVPDLLSEQAGVQIHDFFGNNAATTTVDLRGFGAYGAQNTLILVDGRRVVDIDQSGVQWGAIPLANVERIEIMRGGGSVMYGEGAVGGVINIITRSPFDSSNTGSARMRVGSYDTLETGLTGQYRNGNFGIAATASNFESNGYRANNDNRMTNASADLRWLTEGGEVALRMGTDHQGLRLPGARQVQPSTGVNLLETNRRGTPTPLDWSQRNGNRVTFDWLQRAGAAEFTVAAGWRDKAQRSYFDFSGFPDYRETNLDVWSFSPRVRLAAGSHTVVAGIDWQEWDYGLKRSNSTVNIGRPSNTIDAEQRNLAAYVQDTFKVTPQLTLTGGWRAEQFKAAATDRHDAGAPGGAGGSGAPAAQQQESENAWEAGARYALTPALALIAKTARSYRFANIDEVYETSTTFTNQFQFLRPQTALHHELGTEWRDRGAWLRAAAFEIDVKDEIHLDAFTTGTGNTNLPPSRRRGFELETRWQLSSMLSLVGAYTYTEAKFLSGVFPGGTGTQLNVNIAGKTVPLVPRHKLNAGASWAFAQATRLSANATYVSDQFMDNDQANSLGTKIPAYTVVDLKLTHAVAGWTLGATVNNLFNRKYYNYAVRSQFVADRYNAYPLPERNLGVSAEYAFR